MSTSVSVVVASHGREFRLRWLLNALEEQSFSGSWEVVVVHDYDADDRRARARQASTRAVRSPPTHRDRAGHR